MRGYATPEVSIDANPSDVTWYKTRRAASYIRTHRRAFDTQYSLVVVPPLAAAAAAEHMYRRSNPLSRVYILDLFLYRKSERERERCIWLFVGVFSYWLEKVYHVVIGTISRFLGRSVAGSALVLFHTREF